MSHQTLKEHQVEVTIKQLKESGIVDVRELGIKIKDQNPWQWITAKSGFALFYNGAMVERIQEEPHPDAVNKFLIVTVDPDISEFVQHDTQPFKLTVMHTFSVSGKMLSAVDKY